MKFEIRLPAPSGELVPLIMVAHAKARTQATAGMTPFHRPTYDGSLRGFAEALLREARKGTLTVCNNWGSAGAPGELIAAAEQAGTLSTCLRYIVEPDWEQLQRANKPVIEGKPVWRLTHLDLGPTEPDLVMTHIGALYTTLKWLNDWGATFGDEFTLNHDGVEWVDERGVRIGQSADPVREPFGSGDKSTIFSGSTVVPENTTHATNAQTNHAPAVAVAPPFSVTQEKACDAVEQIAGAEIGLKPWLVHDVRDPSPAQPWYTPARYFAREFIKSESTLLRKRLSLADKVSKSLADLGFLKRGGKKRLAADTVVKAFVNIPFG